MGSPAAASCSLRSKTRGEFSPSLLVLGYEGVCSVGWKSERRLLWVIRGILKPRTSRSDEKADATTQNFHRNKPSE